MKKLRPPFKLCDWAASHFPEGYKKMAYIEPYCQNGSAIMAKTHSAEEVINDTDPRVVNLMRVVRDRCDNLIRHLLSIKYTKTSFEAASRHEFKEDFISAVNEFVLYTMSKGGLKKYFDPNNPWKETINFLSDISTRLAETYIVNTAPLAILSAFNNPNTLVYINNPDDSLVKLLQSYKGKVIIEGEWGGDWRCVRKPRKKLWLNY